MAFEMFLTTNAAFSNTYRILRSLSKTRPLGWLKPALRPGTLPAPLGWQGRATLPVMRVSQPVAFTWDMCPAPVRLKVAELCVKK